MGRCSSNCEDCCIDLFRWSNLYPTLIKVEFGPATCRLAYNKIKRVGDLPAQFGRCTCLVHHRVGVGTLQMLSQMGGMNMVSKRRGRCTFGFFTIFFALAGFIFTNITPFDLLVTCHFAFLLFQSCFLYCCYSFRWHSCLLLTPAAGCPLL